MAVEINITDEFNKLCSIFIPEKKRARLGKPLQSRSQTRRHFKKTLYTALFTFLKDNKRLGLTFNRIIHSLIHSLFSMKS